jgi:hypothetical protein
MVEVVVDVSTLTRSGGGNVTGEIFLRGPAGDFPETRWNDFPVVILGWWIDCLTKAVAHDLSSIRGLFMDGPFAFTIKRTSGQSGRIAWGNRDDELPVGELDLSAFLRSAVQAGKLVSAECRSLGWVNDDLETLERVIARSSA